MSESSAGHAFNFNNLQEDFKVTDSYYLNGPDSAFIEEFHDYSCKFYKLFEVYNRWGCSNVYGISFQIFVYVYIMLF